MEVRNNLNNSFTMSIVEIPREVVDPKLETVRYPYVNFPWMSPTFRDSDGERVPDWLPLVGPYPPKPKELFFPKYTGLPTWDQIFLHPHRIYTWYVFGPDGERKVKTEGYATMPPGMPEEWLMKRYDQELKFHYDGKYLQLDLFNPPFASYCRWFWKKERAEFFEWGPKSFKQLIRPYEILFDAKLQHPTSDFCYSAVRTNPYATQYYRNKYYCRDFRSRVLRMCYLVEFAAIDGHQIIVVEQTALAELMMKRVMYGWYLNATCGIMCFFTWALSHYKGRHPSVFILPFWICMYCWYLDSYEYRTDPCKNYIYWTTWVNDPGEHEVFEYFKIHPDLLRAERMTFMQLEDNTDRDDLNWGFSWIAIYYLVKTMYKRVRFHDVVADLAWDVLKQRTCAEPGSSIRYMQNMFHPFYRRCRIEAGSSFPGRFLFWASLVGFYLFFGPEVVKKFKKTLDWKTRTRFTINRVAYRAIKGERRYARLAQPMYWIYRWCYPRDTIGKRDRIFLSQKFRNQPGSQQFYF